MKKNILKVLTFALILILLTACEKKDQNSEISSEHSQATHSQSTDSDSAISSDIDISSAYSGVTLNSDDNIMPDIFSEPKENMSNEETDNPDKTENSSIISVPSDSEQDKENTDSSDEWSKRY